VFYALLATSATDPGMAKALKLTETKPSAYHYLNQGVNAEAVKRRKAKAETRLTRCVMPGCDLDPMEGKTQCYAHFTAYSARGIQPGGSSSTTSTSGNASGTRGNATADDSDDDDGVSQGSKNKRRSKCS
jgi:hypothetical protein